MADVHELFLKAVEQGVKDLKLDGCPGLAVRRWPWDQKGDGSVIVHRGITIHPVPEEEARGTNEREDIGYGVGVTMIMPADHSPTENVGRIPQWRAKIRRQFINQRLNISFDRASEHVCKVSMGNFPIPREAHKYEMSTLIIRCWMRESRNT